MATAGCNFAALTSAALTGSTYAAAGVLVAVAPGLATSLKSQGLATILDRLSVDLSKAGYDKNGAFLLNLSSSTPATVDLTAVGSPAVTAGDTAFAGWKEMILVNLGAQDVLVSPGSSNPARTPLAGTSPTFTVPAGSAVRWHVAAGLAVDSTHKTLKFDPGSAAATIAVCIGGS